MAEHTYMQSVGEGKSPFQAWQFRTAKAALKIVQFLNNVETQLGFSLREESCDDDGRIVDVPLMVPIRYLNGLRNAFGWVPTHEHLKTGGRYRLLAPATREANLELTAVYENERGQIWLRPMAEFLDGRFKPLEGYAGIHREMKLLFETETGQRCGHE